jgi:outer membrane protein assembly factor BamB
VVLLYKSKEALPRDEKALVLDLSRVVEIMRNSKRAPRKRDKNRLFTMVVIVKYIVILILCFELVSVMTASDWNCFKGSPERRGCSDVPAPDTSYLLWKTDLGSELYASPVVKNGKVFQVAFEEVACIDCDTGDVLWMSSVPAYNSTPVLTDDKVIVATNKGVTALSLENGDFIWEYSISGRFSELELIDHIVSSPTVSEGKVVVGTMPYAYQLVNSYKNNEMYVICLDESTGKEEWAVETCLGVLSSPCITQGKVFAASREMLCIDLEKGRVIWNSEHKYPWDVAIPIKERYAFDRSTPALYHGILVAGSTDMKRSGKEFYYEGWQKIVAIDQYTGEIFWKWVEEGILFSSPAIYQGKVYFYSFDGFFRCLSLLNGELLWQIQISEPQNLELGGSRIWSSPSAADNKVYIGSIEGVFYCIDADTGEVFWMYETGPIHSAPAVVPEKVLISSTDGKVYCFGTDPGTYKVKAEQYIETKIYDKAGEFLIKAKRYAETNEEIKEIDRKLNFVKSEIPKYEKKLDSLSEAEFLMDEADRILWDKKFSEAKELYIKSYKIYTELNDEFGIRFCEERIAYIEKRIVQQGWMETHWWLIIILICSGIILVFLVRVLRGQKIQHLRKL